MFSCPPNAPVGLEVSEVPKGKKRAAGEEISMATRDPPEGVRHGEECIVLTGVFFWSRGGKKREKEGQRRKKNRQGAESKSIAMS